MPEPADRAPVELRVVTTDDWELWRSLRLEALADAPYAFGSTFADWEEAPEARWRERLSLPGGHDLVALADGRPVGMATGVPAEPGTVSLISMYVARDARGTGVAGALIGRIAQWAADRGAARLCLDVRADNTAALRSYERLGLVVVGEVDRDSSDEPLELRMCMPLPG